MDDCSNLYLLSTIACRLAECLSKEELELLASDFTTLGDMLTSIVVRRSVCKDKAANQL